jgi:WD40 repeat protein
MTFSPDGKMLATSGIGRDDQVVLLDVGTKRPIRSFRGIKLRAHSWAFSPDGQLIVIGGGDRTVKIWRIASNDPPIELVGHKQGVMDFAFSPDSRTLVSYGGDRTIKFWNVATKQETLTFVSRTVNSDLGWLVFAPDGKTLAMASVEGDYFMRLWRAPSFSTIERQTFSTAR